MDKTSIKHLRYRVEFEAQVLGDMGNITDAHRYLIRIVHKLLDSGLVYTALTSDDQFDEIMKLFDDSEYERVRVSILRLERILKSDAYRQGRDWYFFDEVADLLYGQDL